VKTLILSFITILAAFANKAEASTRFEDTLAMFDAGTELSSQQLKAAYAGRCFVTWSDSGVADQNDATGALLVGESTQSPSPADDAGPAFPHQDQNRLIVNLVNSANNNPHYRFDAWTEKQAIDTLHTGIKSSGVVQKGISQTWTSTYSSGPVATFEARAYQNYIVVKAIETSAKPGEDLRAACYFYQKLH
jgi:hypothetical protein